MAGRSKTRKGTGGKNAGTRPVSRTGGPERGRGTPASGSPDQSRGCDVLTIPYIPTLDFIPSDSQVPPVSSSDVPGPSPITPHTPAAAQPSDSEAILDQPMITDMDIPSRPVNVADYRLPSMKDIGKDVDGKVIKHYRSEETAMIVAGWASRGASEKFICAMLNMRPGTLRQLYGNEMEHAVEIANLNVAGKAYEMAMSGESDAMTKFWLQARARWRTGDTEDDRKGSLFNIHIHA